MNQISTRKISFQSNLKSFTDKSISDDIFASEIIDSSMPSRNGFGRIDDDHLRYQMTEENIELYNRVLGKNYQQENRMVKNLLSLPSTTMLLSKSQSSALTLNRSQSQRSPPPKERPKVKVAPNIIDRSKQKKLITRLNMFLAKQNNNKKLKSLKRRNSCGCSLCGGFCSKDLILDEIQFQNIDQEDEAMDQGNIIIRRRKVVRSKTIFSGESFGGINFEDIHGRKRVSSLPIIRREKLKRMTSGSMTAILPSAISSRPRFSQEFRRRLTIVQETESTPMSHTALLMGSEMDFPLIGEEMKEIPKNRVIKSLVIRKKSFNLSEKITSSPIRLAFDRDRIRNYEESDRSTEKCQTARSEAESRISLNTGSRRAKTPSTMSKLPSRINLKTEPPEFELDQVVPLKTLLTCQTERGHPSLQINPERDSRIQSFRRRLKVNTGSYRLFDSPLKKIVQKTPLRNEPEKRDQIILKPLSSKSLERTETNLRKTSISSRGLTLQDDSEKRSYVLANKVYNKTLLYKKSLI